MYSNDPKQIRSGLVNYIGALLKASPFDLRPKKQDVVAVLIEESIKLSQDEEKVIDLYVLKPMFKGTSFTLKQRIQELNKLPKNSESDQLITEYENVIITLDKLISKL